MHIQGGLRAGECSWPRLRVCVHWARERGLDHGVQRMGQGEAHASQQHACSQHVFTYSFAFRLHDFPDLAAGAVVSQST